MSAPIFRARRDPKLRARIMSDRHLSYDGDSAALPADRPKHVRAGSGIAWSGERMVLIQDDADYIALIDSTAGAGPGGVAGLRLKSPAGGHLGKQGGGHLQLEAVLTAKDWRGEFVLAFGSGSTPQRRHIARVRLGGGDTELSVFETRKFYAALEELPEFATSTLNIEGVALLAKGVEGRDGVRLFHRANGKVRPGADAGQPLSATVDVRLDALLAYLDRAKRDPNATLGTDLLNVRRYDLDEAGDVPFTFTDAAAMADGRVLFIAAAEKCEDAGIDGENFGTSLGIIDPDGSARFAIIVERDGTPTKRKAEGVAVRNDKSAYIVIDPESDDRPATLCTVDITGV
jgi:Family of unknown function (DUF6929)